MNNPQYHLHIHPEKSANKTVARTNKSRVSFSLSGDRRIPFNVSLVWSQGQRITDLTSNDVALSTGPYRFGHASAVKSLPGTYGEVIVCCSGLTVWFYSAGDYTIIVSAFDARKTGAFHLKIDSSTRIEVNPILQEGSGMFSKTVRGAWCAHYFFAL